MKKVSQENKKSSFPDAPVRLQKLLAEAGVASRRACEALIQSGQVEVNGSIVTKLGTQAVPGKDNIKVNGVSVYLQEKVIYLFNKPKHVISSLSDPRGRPCIGDYVSQLPYRVFPVGRLDYDVCGLIILTNDGLMSQSLLHPKYEVKRVYVARVSGELDDKKKSLLLKGINLPDGFAKASELSILKHSDCSLYEKFVGFPKQNESLIRMVVKEGRNHFVKRILEGVGHPVKGLMREEFGPYKLMDIRFGEIKRVGFNGGLLG